MNNKRYIGVDSSQGMDITVYCVIEVDNQNNVTVLEQDLIKHGKMYVEKQEIIDAKITELIEKYGAKFVEMQPFPSMPQK